MNALRTCCKGAIVGLAVGAGFLGAGAAGAALGDLAWQVLDWILPQFVAEPLWVPMMGVGAVALTTLIGWALVHLERGKELARGLPHLTVRTSDLEARTLRAERVLCLVYQGPQSCDGDCQRCKRLDRAPLPRWRRGLDGDPNSGIGL